jgi:excisionase family DNA binding protein
MIADTDNQNKSVTTSPRCRSDSMADQKQSSKPRTVKQAAEELNVAQSTIRAWIGQRRLGYVRLGRAIRVPASEIQRMLEMGFVPPSHS